MRVLASGMLAAGMLFSGAAISSSAPVAAASGDGPQVYWGAFVNGAPREMSPIDKFEGQAGKQASIVRFAKSWLRGHEAQTFPAWEMTQIRRRGSIPMLGWGSWDSGRGTNQPMFRLANIYNGDFDSYLTQWAADAKAWGHPFFLRMDHEMNGDWSFPWSEQLNGNQPGDFVRAWRHVHDIFTQVGADNATWVWCPNVSGNKTTALQELYPGDNYVDWTCLDGYNWGSDSGNQWQSFAQIYSGADAGGYNHHDTYQEMLKIAPKKPIMLGEVASSEHGGSKASWVTDMLTTQLPARFPQIKAVVWEEWDIATGLTWPIESSPEALAAFKSAISSSYYASNDFGSLPFGKIQPLGPTSAGNQTPPASPTPKSPATPTPPATPKSPAAPTPPPAAPPASSGTLTLGAEADTYTSSLAASSTAGGSSPTLRANRAGTDTAFLRFDLSALKGKTITSATLKLHSSNVSWAGSHATFDAWLVAATQWKEAYMSFTNTEPVSRTLLGSLVAPTLVDTAYDVTLNPAAVQPRAGAKLSMAINSRSTDVLIFYGREAGADLAPELIVNYK